MIDEMTDDIAKADNEHELAERLARFIDSILGSSIDQRIECFKTNEYLTNDAMIKLIVNDTVYLLTVQEDRR